MLYLVIFGFSILHNVSVANAQLNKRLELDTIVVLNVDTLVVHDTITTYFKIHLPVMASFLQNFNSTSRENYRGIGSGLGLSFVRNKLYLGTGLKWSYFYGNSFSDSLYNRFISQRDTVFNLLQEVNGQIQITPIATTYEYHDSVLQVNQTSNRYSLLQFPLTAGFIYDNGNWSVINGMGVLLQLYTPLYESNLIALKPQTIREAEYINRFNIGVLFQNQTLYYLNSQLSVGLQLDATIQPFSIYTENYPLRTHRFMFDVGIVLSYIL